MVEPAQREFVAALLDTLGYTCAPTLKPLDEGAIPILAEVKTKSGAPDLWILETISSVDEFTDPLELNFDVCQYQSEAFALIEEKDRLLNTPVSELITTHIFAQPEPPRWLLVLNFHSLVLIDRSKWNEKRFLRFDFSEILSRKDSSTLKAMAALLHRDSLSPDDGTPLLDTLDENSHKHAFEVSEDLKHSVREAIELLGNEAVWFLINQRKKGVFGESETAEKLDPNQLTRECLRYLYRMLFVLYIEARPELGYSPIRKSEQYAKGYSFESLRDLELIPLTTDESRNGYFINESIRILFKIIFDGFNIRPATTEMYHTGVDAFSLVPLKSHLFDPARTPLLEKVRFRNNVLQQVIQLLSLSRPKNGQQRRGRISYAQLGINQLGAVYEGLLSYTGFFAQTDLYEVKRPDQEYNELEAAFFVTAEDLPKYEENEKVFNPDGSLKKFEKGTFIYRLAGRSREKSASYYTPEVLTKCLVKYALKELLKDKKADDILHLTVCEMALGSGAFANEAVNQLAEAYLDRKQRETGRIVPPDQYATEKQKVKMFIADHNVFGVDLNPVAVELAEISLWLNTIFDGAYVPWFGMQLVAGNSLIGARRQVFSADDVIKQERGQPSWLDLVPERRPLKVEKDRDKLTSGDIFHFLLPDSGMADYADKVVKQLAPTEMDHIKKWRKKFIQPFDEGEVTTLLRYTKTIDKLWRKHVDQQQRIILDFSASIAVERSLAVDQRCKARRISVFLNQRGNELVMLAEDTRRTADLVWLESLYFRAVGFDKRLAGHFDLVQTVAHRYGNSCREISAVFRQDMVATFAGLAAGRIRKLSSCPDSCLTVHRYDECTGGVTAIEIEVTSPLKATVDDWQILVHSGVVSQARALRAEKLPAETGGVLLGLVDRHHKFVTILGLLPAPPDSKEWPTSFIRGSSGLSRNVAEIANNTLGNLAYIGEWHSHPRGHSANPSSLDWDAIALCSPHMEADGLPTLMLIFGDRGDIRLVAKALGKSNGTVTKLIK